MQSISGMLNVFISPVELWEQLRKKRQVLMPLVCLLGLAVATQFAYFSNIDMDWFLETTVFSEEDISPSEKQQVASIMTRSMLLLSAISSAVFITLILISIVAVYFHLISKIIGKQRPFSQWFTFSVWGHFPLAITSIIALITIFLSDSGQLSTQILSATSFNALFLHLPASHNWYNWADTASVVMLWQMFLMTVGFKIWTGISTVSAITIATAPYIMVMGLWALSILL